jgi:hypothetical protein
VRRGIGGDEQRGHAQAVAVEALEQFDAVHGLHADVAHEAAGLPLQARGQEVHCRFERARLPAERAHQAAGGGAHEGVVVDDGNEIDG